MPSIRRDTASSMSATPIIVAPASSAARETCPTPCPYAFAFITAITFPPVASRTRRILCRIAGSEISAMRIGPVLTLRLHSRLVPE